MTGHLGACRFMNVTSFAVILTAVLVALTPAQALDNPGVERLATCQDSWLDWKENDPAQLTRFAEAFRAQFTLQHQKMVGGEDEEFFAPKSSQTVIGLPIAAVLPQNFGMAVGFFVVVGENFENTRKNLEKKIGKRFTECGSDGHQCSLKVGEKKTVELGPGKPENGPRTLFGCFYFLER